MNLNQPPEGTDHPRNLPLELETFDELLRALSEALDVRKVLPRVSTIVQRILTHDRMVISFHEADGAVGYGVSNDDGPQLIRVRFPSATFISAGTHKIRSIGTLDPLWAIEPPDFEEQTLAAGYRSLMAVAVLARERLFGVLFLAKTVEAFVPQDLMTARRVAEHLALALSHEELAEALRRSAEAEGRAQRLAMRVQVLTEQLDSRQGYARVVGTSPPWLAVVKQATQVAATETTVLLTGESGTGKEVIARLVHRESPRRAGPFVALNCAALPEQLLEAELFGYERGAFTGAQQPKPGQIEVAAGGVLFLDEIGELSPGAQAKLLRVLQEREFSRLGATKVLRADVRVIAATNRNLMEAIARGDFREDLYYRLQVFEIRLPPLRERPTDILPMSEAFLEDIGRAFGRAPAGLTQEAKDELLRRPWPGNARELHNALERAAILSDGSLIATAHLPPPLALNAAAALGTDLGAHERHTIAQVMGEVNGNKSRAAKRLGITRSQLYQRLKRHDFPT